MRLAADFYARPVLEVARDLIGCILEHRGVSGRIVETEAYHESEPACHAFVGVTQRTRTLFGEPGLAYVYRSYGIHAMLNAVCEPVGVGAAVLIRALEPLEGIEEMRLRRESAGRGPGRGGERAPLRDRDLCSGPGKLTQALGVELSENASSLLDGPLVIESASSDSRHPLIVSDTRIGITKAVDLRWRFCAAGNPHVSRPWPEAVGISRRGVPLAREEGAAAEQPTATIRPD
ncbi:MAG TPA: DNA-3-methyladenine glycosylase [Solirubrobacteraceae bacterium]|jgi:DNA-3-methyladenine glycosylase|nr:DNA-3-methyladenine glycosylase [Solirubrobacteraceae bacterium]